MRASTLALLSVAVFASSTADAQNPAAMMPAPQGFGNNRAGGCTFPCITFEPPATAARPVASPRSPSAHREAARRKHRHRARSAHR